ncbi:MAG: sulfate adenylyltransferase subunit CysD [Pseudomonadota bacterium]|nr:sulfate adenylyltransferase subunit CysD [Pseudomonadota bacterium]
MYENLRKLENESVYIIRQAFRSISNIAMLWSLGKDSNVMVWLAFKAFLGKIPFPLVHVDTGRKFKEMYKFREEYREKWKLNLIKGQCPSLEKIDPSLPPAARSAARKTEGLKEIIRKYKFKGIIAGIRRDEQGTRAKERVFSPRDETGNWDVKNQPPEFWDQSNFNYPENVHVRVHPLLGWTELDIWQYIKHEKIPIVDLYFSKEGRRYRSLGDKDITSPVKSDARNIDEIIEELKVSKISERSGRAMDHEEENVFEKLRTKGYM